MRNSIWGMCSRKSNYAGIPILGTKEEKSMGGWDGQLGALLDYFSNRGYHVAHTGDWTQDLVESPV